MPITEKTVYVTSDGRHCETRDEAERLDLQAAISLDLVKIDNEYGNPLFPQEADRDEISWHAKELLAILKKHLDPEQPKDELPFAMTDEEAYGRLSALHAGASPLDSAEDAVIWSLLRHRGELAAVLALYPDEQTKRFAPLEAPIDERAADTALQSLFQAYPTGMGLGDWIEELMKHRREVVMILQGIERPETISEDEAMRKLQDMGLNHDASYILKIKDDLIATLQAVRP